MFDGVEVPAPRTVQPIVSRGAKAEGVVGREGMTSDHLESHTLKLARTDSVTIMDLQTATYVFPSYRFDPDSLPTHSDCHEAAYAD
jgi:hypothetical protein